eukprot:scaffold305_cov60-Attheya_sp.AAC.5
MGPEPPPAIRIRRGVSEPKGDVAVLSLEGKEVWIFTDSKVLEAVYHKGNGMHLRIVHIDGTRMIAEGADRLSRGELHLAGFFDGELQSVPLYLDPLVRSPQLKEWLHSWVLEDTSTIRIAKPGDWFLNANKPTHTWIWSLPPAAAIAIDALEELSIARLKRQDTRMSIVLVSLLLTPEWFRRFCRVVDVYFLVQPSTPFWSSNMHEPLLVGCCFPLLRGEPWVWKRALFMVGLGRSLSQMHKTNWDVRGDLLRKFWAARSRAARMPPNVVRTLLLRESPHPFLSLSQREEMARNWS